MNSETQNNDIRSIHPSIPYDDQTTFCLGGCYMFLQ